MAAAAAASRTREEGRQLDTGGRLTTRTAAEGDPSAARGVWEQRLSGYAMTPSGEQPPPEAVKQPILERARKMAATWVTSEDGEASYRDWMEFCEDWVRHRLKQNYYGIHDVVRWERATGPPHAPASYECPARPDGA